LLPNGPQEESPEARPLLRALTAEPALSLVYVTGRDARLIQAAMAEYELPEPRFAVGDVGTTIYRIHEGRWEPLEAWASTLEPDWAGATRDDLAAELAGFDQMRVQPPEKLGRFKLSYYVDPEADLDALAAAVGERLVGQNVRAGLITSFDESEHIGLLDVLPAGANKLHALRFLLENEGCPLERAVFAGDSGNDLAVLESEIPAVLVRNAREEVRREALERARAAGNEAKLYLAAGGLLGMNGNYSAGALEGLRHFIPESGAWLGRAWNHL
jgi:HAD superfamily hydrolase (TIGR01484 family)